MDDYTNIAPRPTYRLHLPGTQTQATYTLIAVNVVTFVLQSAWESIVYGYGALMPALVIFTHQWWRLLTSGFLHGDIMHIATNLYALHGLGRLTERFFGVWRFLIIYAVSLLGAGVLVTLFSPLQSVTVGASGAVMGVLGALLFFFQRYRNVLVGGSKLFNELLKMAVLNIGIGLLPGISLWGHVGGFVAGLLIGSVLCPQYQTDEMTAQLQRTPLSPPQIMLTALMPVGWALLLGMRIVLARME